MKRKKILSMVLAGMMACSLMGTTVFSKEEIKLNVTVRDFKEDGVLFEGRITSDEGLVGETLGSDHKPVYNLSKWQEMFGETKYANASREQALVISVRCFEALK